MGHASDCNRPEIQQLYDSSYGDDKLCQCGHTYYRHFDWLDDMQATRCKYCPCEEFKEAENS